MEKKINKFIYWTPRILSIIFIFLLALMSLDVFSSELNLWQTVVGLFIHNIPALILLVVLLISWKHDLVGATAFFIFAVLYIWMVGLDRHWSWYASISAPAAIIGVLFFINWLQKKKFRDI